LFCSSDDVWMHAEDEGKYENRFNETKRQA